MLDAASLVAGLRALSPARDAAPIQLLVQRQPGERRLTPPSVTLDPELGVVGDQWSADLRPKLEAQVTLMRWDVAKLMHPQPEILGDNLFASLDTSAENLPPGTVVRVGAALCAVTPKPHTGCSKFQKRVGKDALKLTRAEDWRAHQLRGVHLRVLERGEVRLGDEIQVVQRADAPGWEKKLRELLRRRIVALGDDSERSSSKKAG